MDAIGRILAKEVGAVWGRDSDHPRSTTPEAVEKIQGIMDVAIANALIKHGCHEQKAMSEAMSVTGHLIGTIAVAIAGGQKQADAVPVSLQLGSLLVDLRNLLSLTPDSYVKTAHEYVPGLARTIEELAKVESITARPMTAEEREGLVENMCFTLRHDFGLLDETRKAGIRLTMGQVLDNDGLPAFERNPPSDDAP